MKAGGSFNLIRYPWIPVVTRHGRRFNIRPQDLTLDFGNDPIVDVAWPRADFRIGAYEFLIGLLTTACVPRDNSTWRRWWVSPPSVSELAACFSDFESAFEMRGNGPRFMQDRAELGEDEFPISGLLIEQPGSNTEKNNADLFVKRQSISVLGLPAAAMALYVMQSFAPSGGAGHRTSLRGGGPLTTLALPPDDAPQFQTLWHKLWLNVSTLFHPLDQDPRSEEEGRVFPWQAETRTSDKDGVITTPEDVHPAQCFWGMPRRISLVIEENTLGAPCAITGVIEELIVRIYRTRPWGVNYQSVTHPLTPTYTTKPGAEWLPVHPQPGGVAYRQWLSYVQSSETRRPAACIVQARQRLQVINGTAPRIMIVGYDMDNMKARSFVEAEMPLLFASEPLKQDVFEQLCNRLISCANEVAGLLVGQIRFVLEDQGNNLDLVRETFFKSTELAFFKHLEDGLKEIESRQETGDLLADLGMNWLGKGLAPQALAIFDRQIPIGAIISSANLKKIEKLADARSNLATGLKGYGSAGKRIFTALQLEPPKAKKKGEKQ